jgi:hypothetical protein
MKTATILVILALLIFATGCTQQQAPTTSNLPVKQAQAPAANNAAPQTPPATPSNPGTPAAANNPATGNDASLDVPSDIVGDNPDTGTVQTTDTDTSDLSS